MSNDEELRIQMENDLRKLKEKLKKDPADPLAAHGAAYEISV